MFLKLAIKETYDVPYGQWLSCLYLQKTWSRTRPIPPSLTLVFPEHAQWGSGQTSSLVDVAYCMYDLHSRSSLYLQKHISKIVLLLIVNNFSVENQITENWGSIIHIFIELFYQK